MTHLTKTRTVAYIAFGVAATGLLAFVPADVQAQNRRRRAAVVINLQTPLGLQGTRGAGDNVIIPFSLRDRSRAATNVEVQYGVDQNDDGIIYPGDSEVDVQQRTGQDAEYVKASEDRLAPENTRKNRRPQLFSTAARVGAAHAFAWKSSSDIESAAFPTSQFQFTPDGRFIPDPNNPGSSLFAPTQPGLKIRIRSVRGKGRRKRVGAWAYTDAFALNNNTPPGLTIDEVVIPDPLANPPVLPNEIVEIKWTAFDDNSEDLDGDGEFDPIDGEDRNGNNELDNELVAAAFDYYEIKPGETPQTMTLEELAALDWKECTNADPEGNLDAIRDAGGQIVFDGYASAPTGVSNVGNQHSFLWNSLLDIGTINGEFIVRARPFDVKREHGLYDYANTPFTVDNWKIFNTADPAPPEGTPGDSDLAGPRVGHTVTSLTTVLAPPFGNVDGGRTDPSVAQPKLAFLVAGGATSVDGPGTTDAVLYRAGTVDAPTTSAARDSRPIAFNAARSYHTATLLDDGRVLFAGGLSAAGTPLTSTEIYDPIDHAITPGAPMNVARAKHAAVRLASGDVAIFGGITTGVGAPVLNSVEIFRFEPYPGSGSFDLLTNPRQTMAVAQHSVHAVVLPDQHILVTGGVDAAGNAVTVAEHMDALNDENFDGLNDPTTKDPVFETVGSMGVPRLGGGATRLISGDVLFSGGAGVSSLEVFNHELHQFEPVDVAMEDGARSQHIALRMGDDSVLLAGGITNPTSGTIVPSADLFVLGAYTPGTPVGTWTGSFLRVNGDMVTPRRLAAASALINGKVIIAGGEDGSATLSSLETFTPDNAINRLPTASVELQSDQQSWAFGAPVQYRLVDPEGDRAFVTVQYSSDSKVNWTAASPQATTIGGDVAETDADLITTTADDLSRIDPIGRVEDHLYIWGMSNDLVRPPTGTSVPGFNVRVIPFGALQGNLGVSDPITVLSNTKVIPTIYPLADRNGVDDPNRGGDIEIWVHLRDIDGPAVPPGTTQDPRPGETVQTLAFEYAVDANDDGQIGADEFWTEMTPRGAGSAATRAISGAKAPDDLPDPDNGKPDGKNVLENLTSFSEAPGDTNDTHPLLLAGGRPAEDGWHVFHWDSVYDIDAPATTRDNVWIRVIPKDDDIGFTATLRNEPGVTKFINVRDQDAIWLDTFTPKGGSPASVKPNEAIDLLLNALVHPDSVNATTLLASSNGSTILGEYTVVQNAPDAAHPAGSSLITFWPLGQSTVDDVDVYAPGDPFTVQQPGMNITITIPGYLAGEEPDLAPTVPTLVPDNGAYVDGTFAYPGPASITSTYLMVQNVPTSISYDVVAGNHDDGVPGTLGSSDPIDGDTIPGAAPTDSITLTVNKAVDHTTVKSPNIQVFVDSGGGVDSVIPGRWTVTNEQVLSPDKTTLVTNSILTFTPFIQYPSGVTIKILANSGLKTEAGNPIQNGGFSPSADGFATTYSITAYGQTGDGITENFESTDYEDATVQNRTNWGNDPCAADTLTGLQIAPLGASTQGSLTVGNGQVSTITSASLEYDDIVVEKGGILRIRVPGTTPATIRAKSFTIKGTVDLRGEDGWSGSHGNTLNTSVTYGPTANHTTGFRAGGKGHTGGRDGGRSRNSTSSSRGQAGDAGLGTGRGGGGGVGSRYWYGGAGGGGAGFGNRGFAGGKSWSSGNAGGTGGTTYGTEDFSGGVLGGSGGGAGGTQKDSSRTHQGGGGGAGGGAVTLESIGDFVLAPSGFIDGRGGDGGAKHFYGGAGGGGSGGGVMIRAGTGATLDGVIDLRGGQGGPPGVGYYSDFYANSNVSTQGTPRRGGDGGGGRLAVFAPNLLGADQIRVKGQFMSRKVNSVPSGSGGAQTQPSAFTNGTPESSPYRPTGSTLHLTSLTIAAGKTVNIESSNTSSQPLAIYVDNDITIDGTLTINGRIPTYGYDEESTNAPARDGGGTRSFRPSATVRNGNAPSTLGSGAGAKGLGNSGADLFEGYDATGAGGGKHKLKKTGTPLRDSRTWFYYYTGDAGGGGGGSATPGDDGWAPYAAPPKYNYFGAINDTNNKGISSDVRRGISGANRVEDNALKHGGPGGDTTDITNVSISNFGTFAGSGGGGGNSGGFNNWNSYRYYGYAGHAGSGAGALALVAQGTVNINGTIEAIGGAGNPPGNTLRRISSNFNWSAYAHSGGGAGSGGFVYVMGQNVNIDAVSADSPGSGSGGATVDLGGGIGGGVRSTMDLGSVDEKYPSYYSYGSFGGNGGFGRMVVDYVGELNGVDTPVFNKYGNQETNFGDSTYARYTALGGTATSGCLFAGGSEFQSQWYDLDSVRPLVTALNLSGVEGDAPTIFGQGAQSHPHAVGRAADGSEPWRTSTGEPDPNNVSTQTQLTTAGHGTLLGYRWFRFIGTLNRSPTSDVPVVDEVDIVFTRDTTP